VENQQDLKKLLESGLISHECIALKPLDPYQLPNWVERQGAGDENFKEIKGRT
jgi:hypothetical protein